MGDEGERVCSSIQRHVDATDTDNELRQSSLLRPWRYESAFDAAICLFRQFYGSIAIRGSQVIS